MLSWNTSDFVSGYGYYGFGGIILILTYAFNMNWSFFHILTDSKQAIWWLNSSTGGLNCWIEIILEMLIPLLMRIAFVMAYILCIGMRIIYDQF